MSDPSLMEPEVREASRRKDHLPLHRLFPNFVTIMGLCSGLTAIRFALDGRFEHAAIAIIVAAILDGMDGRLARLLNASSNFGAQLDSLADFISFGVAPAIIMYVWTLQNIRGAGWAVALFFAVCCAIRLARFNSDMFEPDEEDEKPSPERFFTGAPAPAGGLLALAPLMISFEPEFYSVTSAHLPWVNAGYVAIIAMLMASRIPTFSFKKMRIRQEYGVYVMAAAGLLITFAIIEPWITFPAIGIGYLALLPFSWRAATR